LSVTFRPPTQIDPLAFKALCYLNGLRRWQHDRPCYRQQLVEGTGKWQQRFSLPGRVRIDWLSGPDPAVDGVVRWRRIDLQKVIKARFGVDYHERHVSTLLKKLGFSHMSARPRHPAQDGAIVEAYKKTSRAR
jgi:hypothetical protein